MRSDIGIIILPFVIQDSVTAEQVDVNQVQYIHTYIHTYIFIYIYVIQRSQWFIHKLIDKSERSDRRYLRNN